MKGAHSESRYLFTLNFLAHGWWSEGVYDGQLMCDYIWLYTGHIVV